MWQAGSSTLTSLCFMTVFSRVVHGNQSVVERDNITFTCSQFASSVTFWVGPDGSGQQSSYTSAGQTTILDSVPQKNRLYVQVVQGSTSFMTLTIAFAVKTDAGTYQCTDGSQYFPFVLQVTDPNLTVYVTQGTQSILPCPLTSVINNLQWSGPPGVTIYNSRGTTKLNINGLPADFVSRMAMNATTGALIINNTERTDDNLYKCNVGGPTNYVQLTVMFPPTHVSISNNRQVTEGDSLILRCTTDVSNPAANITWRNGTTLLSGGQNVDQTGEYGGKVRYQEVIIITTRYMDGNIITCTADIEGITGSGVINKTVMDIKFSPIVTVSISPSMLVIEGTKDVIFRCTAWSKPISHFQLAKGDNNVSIYEGEGEDDNNIEFTISTVSRTHGGTYACLADNGVGGSLNERQKRIELLVQYPPDINITTSNVTTRDQKATLICSPNGYPDNYTFGLWQHSWPGDNRILRLLTSFTRQKSSILELQNLTYEESGIYTCLASNGIRAIETDKEFKTQSAYLLVKSAPKILHIRENFEGSIGQSVSVQFDFYSNTDDKLSVTAKHFKSIGISYLGSIQTVHLDSLSIQSFFVSAPGYRASLHIHLTSEDDFGQYTIEVGNIIGYDVRDIKIIREAASTESTLSVGIGPTIGIGLGGLAIGVIGAIVISTIRRRRNVLCSQWVKRRRTAEVAIHTYCNSDVNLQPVSSPYEEIHSENTDNNVYDKISGAL